MSFFRYPGGKSKLIKPIFSYFNIDSSIEEYREPFFGGGSIGIEFLKRNKMKRIWINDYDKALSDLWESVIKHPDELKKLVMNFVPSVKEFDSIRNKLIEGNVSDTVNNGFMKLAIHQISYSGLGLKSGGPLGGREQKSEYKINCRWSPSYICNKIDAINNLFADRNVQCTNTDFSKLITDTSKKAFIYLDPPYYMKGNDLYYYGFSEKDHIRLMNLLKETKHKWVLSYDDCPQIRELYSWARIHSTEVNYSITSTIKEDGERTGNKKMEVIITNA